MGIEKIELSGLTGKLLELAQSVDDGNKVLEGKEIEIFQGKVADAGLNETEDYKAIFGADLKAAPEKKQKINYSEKDVETKQNAIKDYVKALVKSGVSPENLMANLDNGGFSGNGLNETVRKEVEYVFGLVTKAVKGSKETDTRKAIEKIDDTAKKQMIADDKWDDFHKDIYNALKEQAKEAQIHKELQALMNEYSKIKGEGIDYKKAVEKVKNDLQGKDDKGKEIEGAEKSWDKSYTKEAFERLVQEAKGDALDYVDVKLGEIYRGVQAGTITEANAKEKLEKLNTTNDDYIKEAIDKRKTEIKITNRGANVNKRASELTKVTREDLQKELGNELFEKLDRIYLNSKDVRNEDGTYNLSQLSKNLVKYVGADYKANRSDNDKAMDEKQNIKEEVDLGIPITNNKKSKYALTTKDVEKLLDFCKIEKEGKDRTPKVYKLVRDGVVGAFASGGFRKMTQTVTINIAEDSAEETLSELASQGIKPTITDLGNGKIAIKIFQQMITPDVLLGMGLGVVSGALFDMIFGNDRDEKSCMSLTKFDYNNPTYTDAEKYKKHVNKIYADSPAKADALCKLVDAYHKEYGDDWAKQFDTALKLTAGPGSTLNPEECKTLKYQQPPKKAPVSNPPVSNPPVSNPPVNNPPVNNPPATEPECKVYVRQDINLDGKDGRPDSKKYYWDELIRMYYSDCLIENGGSHTEKEIRLKLKRINNIPLDYTAVPSGVLMPYDLFGDGSCSRTDKKDVTLRRRVQPSGNVEVCQTPPGGYQYGTQCSENEPITWNKEYFSSEKEAREAGNEAVSE